MTLDPVRTVFGSMLMQFFVWTGPILATTTPRLFLPQRDIDSENRKLVARRSHPIIHPHSGNCAMRHEGQDKRDLALDCYSAGLE